ncbi:hypothetical protein Tco_0738539 [Tanacetum coccineum]
MVMYLVKIVKFCDATLERVLNEVKLKIFKAEFLKKAPLVGELDFDIMKAYEIKITKRLSTKSKCEDVQTKPSISNNDLDIINLRKENEKILRFNKDFTKTFEKLLKEKRSLESEKLKLLSKINDLEIEVKKLINDKEEVEPCKKYEVLTK